MKMFARAPAALARCVRMRAAAARVIPARRTSLSELHFVYYSLVYKTTTVHYYARLSTKKSILEHAVPQHSRVGIWAR
jgi:hypothetical protein